MGHFSSQSVRPLQTGAGAPFMMREKVEESVNTNEHCSFQIEIWKDTIQRINSLSLVLQNQFKLFRWCSFHSRVWASGCISEIREAVLQDSGHAGQGWDRLQGKTPVNKSVIQQTVVKLCPYYMETPQQPYTRLENCQLQLHFSSLMSSVVHPTCCVLKPPPIYSLFNAS